MPPPAPRPLALAACRAACPAAPPASAPAAPDLLVAAEGPYRLVLPGDGRPARRVRRPRALAVRRAP